ncbi:MAG: acetyl-CoA C-acetyltransferase [Dehalococcoidia bacterium]|nr:acetyl-CoA C-acetyltransferase [Dehalococcoidia bacterium]
MREVVIVSGARTAIGNYGGALLDVPAARLCAITIKEALKRAGIRPKRNPVTLELNAAVLKGTDPIDIEKQCYDWDSSLKEAVIDEVVVGNVLQAGQGQNPGRLATIWAGLNREVPAYTVNKLCGSSLKSIALAADTIRTGDSDIVVAAGMENMSAVPYYFPKARWGARMFNTELLDGMLQDGLWETFLNYHMGMTSENIAAKMGISREEQDRLALVSNQRALAAIKAGLFKDEIVPVPLKVKKETKLFDTDEHPRDTSMEALGKLPPVFKNDGSVTAGNASGITDGAAALVLMSADKAKELGIKPLAYIRAHANAGIDPAYMGLGPIPAVRKALKTAGITLKDLDVIELNEAFASQALGVVRELGLDTNKTNVNGGGISLGHPIGATGARITVTLLYEMKRRNARYGMSALCIGGGQGMAVIVEAERPCSPELA